MLPDPPSEIALLPSTHHPALDPLSSPENLTTLHPRREKSRPDELDGKLLTHFLLLKFFTASSSASVQILLSRYGALW